MRRMLVASIVIQSLGATASLAVVLALARMSGPDVQGEFATIKAASDLAVALLTLGAPSGFVYVVNKGLYDRASLRRASLYCLPAVFVVGGMCMFVLLTASGVAAGHRSVAALLLALAIACLSYFTLARSLMLTVNDGAMFAVYTALPAMVLLVTTLAFAPRGGLGIPAAFAISGLISAVTLDMWLARRLKKVPARPAALQPKRLEVLARQSAHSLAQAAFQAGAVFAPVLAIQIAGAGNRVVGLFNLVGLTIIVPNLLLGMLAPVLYNRWSRSNPGYVSAIVRRAAVVAAGFQLVVAAMTPLVFPLLHATLGHEYSPAGPPIVLLSFAMAPLVFTRVVAPLLQATGTTGAVTAAWGCRLGTFVVMIPMLTLGVLTPLSYAVVCLFLAEYVATVPILRAVHRSRRAERRTGTSAPTAGGRVGDLPVAPDAPARHRTQMGPWLGGR